MSTETERQQYLRAQQLYQMKRHDEALALLDALVQHHPNSADLHYARALCLSECGRKEEALRLCDLLIGKRGHARAQQLKQRILRREPAPNLVEIPAGPIPKPTRAASKSRLAPLAVAVLLAAVLGGAYLYFSQDSGMADAPPAPAASVLLESGGTPVDLINATGGALDVWVDQTAPTDRPAVTIPANGEQTVRLQSGTRQVRARAAWGNGTRYFTMAHPVELNRPARLIFYKAENESGITEVQFRLE